jgi:ATP-dependent phosphofructokinase / diphosphate-dependent phosphofructokinase
MAKARTKKVRRLGVLTSGGDAPGLNAVIRGLVKVATFEHGVEVLGIRDGFEGLLTKENFTPLYLSSVRGLLPRGGTILGTRNAGRFSIFFEGGSAATKSRLIRTAVAKLRRHMIDALVVVGGEGSLAVAQAFHEAGFPIVGVPKTIDNDLSATDYTFGYDTAVNTATDALDRLTTTAQSHDRVMILEVMGRHAGWIALGAGLAGGADIILIPEVPFRVAGIARHIRLRASTGARFHLIVVAEGARPAGAARHYYETAHGQKRLGGIAAWLTAELGKKIPNEVRATVLGHIQRGGSPSAFDRVLASRFGAYAAQLAVAGIFGEMVCLRTPDLRSVPIRDAIKTYNVVDPDADIMRSARAMGISFGE